jgi:hypothetical protein
VRPFAYRKDHTEAVNIQFDPDKITYEDLLDVFWAYHDSSVEYDSPQVITWITKILINKFPEEISLCLTPSLSYSMCPEYSVTMISNRSWERNRSSI